MPKELSDPYAEVRRPTLPHADLPPALAWTALLVLMAAWAVLAFTHYRIGATEIDGCSYADVALHPRHEASFQNRYIHVWGLRVVYALFDSGVMASAAYSTACTWATMLGGFVIGRVVGGYLTGVLSALLLMALPSRLLWPTSNLPDPPMAAWATLAIAAAVLASECQESRGRALRWAASGLLCFFAIKTKETALGVLPAVALLGIHQFQWRRCAGAWIVGALLGWLTLAVLDAYFLGDFFHSMRRASYRPPNLSSMLQVNTTGSMRRDYLFQLGRGPHWGFLTLGLVGFYQGWRQSTVVRTLVVWFAATLTFVTLISWVYRGVSPIERYIVVLETPLALGAAYACRELLTRRGTGTPSRAGATMGMVGMALLMASQGGAQLLGVSEASALRLAGYAVRPGMLLTLVGCLIVPALWFRRASAALLCSTLVFFSAGYAGQNQETLRQRLVGIDQVLGLFETGTTTPVIGIYQNLETVPPRRLEQRLRARGTRPLRDVEVLRTTDPEVARTWDVVFAPTTGVPDLVGAGLRVFTEGAFRGGKNQPEFVALVP